MSTIFDNITELPNREIAERTKHLIGFEDKYNRIFSNLKLLLDQEGLIEWSKKFHKIELPVISLQTSVILTTHFRFKVTT